MRSWSSKSLPNKKAFIVCSVLRRCPGASPYRGRIDIIGTSLKPAKRPTLSGARADRAGARLAPTRREGLGFLSEYHGILITLCYSNFILLIFHTPARNYSGIHTECNTHKGPDVILPRKPPFVTSLSDRPSLRQAEGAAPIPLNA